MTYRPKCPTCGEPGALPQAFDGIDRAIRQPWCENDACSNYSEPVDVELVQFDTIQEREDFYCD